MQRIAEIRKAREQRFYEKRMRARTRKEKLEALRELEQNANMVVKSPAQTERVRQVVQRLRDKQQLRATITRKDGNAASKSTKKVQAADDSE